MLDGSRLSRRSFWSRWHGSGQRVSGQGVAAPIVIFARDPGAGALSIIGKQGGVW